MNEKFRSVISHSSDDKVKVVYSWFGPKGPIWNTELPNILTFSTTAEGVNPNFQSRHFWTDDIWQKHAYLFDDIGASLHIEQVNKDRYEENSIW